MRHFITEKTLAYCDPHYHCSCGWWSVNYKEAEAHVEEHSIITIERAAEIIKCLEGDTKTDLFCHFVGVFNLSGYTTPQALENFACMCGYHIASSVHAI